MRKLLGLTMALAMVLTLAACGGKPDVSQDDPTPGNTHSIDTQPENSAGSPSISTGPVNTPTQDGVYLYNGTFLANGETLTINPEGASINLSDIELKSTGMSRRSDGANAVMEDHIYTLVIDGITPVSPDRNISDTLRNPGSVQAGYYGEIENGVPYQTVLLHDNLTVLGDGAEDTRIKDLPAVSAAILLSNTMYRDGMWYAWELNDKPLNAVNENNADKVVAALGEPAGACCISETSQYGDTRPYDVFYFWKTNDNTIIAYQISYSWMHNNADVEENNMRAIYIVLDGYDFPDLVRGFQGTEGVVTALQALGLR